MKRIREIEAKKEEKRHRAEEVQKEKDAKREHKLDRAEAQLAKLQQELVELGRAQYMASHQRQRKRDIEELVAAVLKRREKRRAAEEEQTKLVNATDNKQEGATDEEQRNRMLEAARARQALDAATFDLLGDDEPHQKNNSSDVTTNVESGNWASYFDSGVGDVGGVVAATPFQFEGFSLSKKAESLTMVPAAVRRKKEQQQQQLAQARKQEEKSSKNSMGEEEKQGRGVTVDPAAIAAAEKALLDASTNDDIDDILNSL